MRFDTVTAPDIAQLLGVSRARIWQLAKKPDFPRPVGDEGGRPYWSTSEIWRWCAGRPQWADAAPLLYRPPSPAHASRFLEARAIDQQVVLVWQTDLGEVGVTYDFHRREPDLEVLQETGCVAVARVSDYWDLHGPEITALDQAQPERSYRLRWSELAPRLGGAVPWWPASLRRVEDMIGWHPDDGEIIVPAAPECDTEALLRVAADAHPDSPVGQALNDLARTMHLRQTRVAERDAERVRGSDVGGLALIAARPTPVSERTTPVSELTVRRAWLDILHRCDPLALRCVRAARAWNGGDDFPWSSNEQIHAPLQPLTAGWRERLQEVPVRNAPVMFELVRRRATTTLYVDPLTGAPVGADANGTLTAAIPHQLPASSPLDSIILSDGVVWLRTKDDHLWLMPQHGGAGVSWGYCGTGPATLAVTIARLLDDITSPAVTPSEPRETHAGLHRLTEARYQEPVVLSRAELESARRD